MITKETILILEAGASCPYGFLDGKGLREDICNNFLPKLRIIIKKSSLSNQYAIDVITQAEEFINSFSKIEVQSLTIDQFLYHNKKYQFIGKIAIILSILDQEHKSKFGNKIEDKDKREQDWYSDLFERLHKKCPVGDLDKNNIKIITFNYDRSLEHFLFENLSALYSDKRQIANYLNKNQIIHVYGKVGSLEWQSENDKFNQTSVKYREECSFEKLEKLCSNIFTIKDKNGKMAAEKAKDVLRISNGRIYFLGFKYDSDNMEQLGLPTILKRNKSNVRIYGTAYKSDPRWIHGLKSNFLKGARPHNNRVNIYSNDCRWLVINENL